MCGYAFMEAPVEPRTMFRIEGTDAPGVSDGGAADPTKRASALERVILDTLICFPDAYHAVVAAMREADGFPPGTA
jgi:hypothetical protein